MTDNETLEQSQKEAADLLASKLKEKDKAAGNKQQAVTALEIAEALGKSFDVQKGKQKDLADSLQKTDEIDRNKASIQRAEKAASIAPKWQLLQTVLNDIKTKQVSIIKAETDKENAEVRVSKAQQTVTQVDQEYKQRDDLKAEETTVKQYQEQLATYQTLKDASVLADKNHKQAISLLSVLEEQAQTISKDLDILQSEIESLEKSTANKAECVEKKLMAKGLLDKRKELETAGVDLLRFNEIYQLHKGKLELADKVNKKVEKDANRTEMLWFSNQAAVLAATLEDNHPCTVCGSLDHPNPAHFADDAVKINQQAVDAARELQAKQFKVVGGIKETVQGHLHSVTDKEKDVKQLEKNLADNANKSVDEIAANYQTLEKELKQIESKETQLHRAKIQKSKKENEAVPIANQIKEIEAQTPELTTRKATANSELDSVNKTLPEVYRNSEAIKQVLNKIGKKITNIESKYTAANKEQTDSLTNQSSVQSKLNSMKEGLEELNLRQKSQSQLWEKALINSDFVSQEDFAGAQLADDELEVIRNKVISHEDSIKALQAELGLLNKQLKDKQLPDLEKLQQQYDELKGVFVLAEQSWTEANQQLKKLSDTQKKIEQIENQQTEIKKQYEIVGTLSKAASGRGNVRVSLERFVLGNILDQVLSIASDRLHIMSKGQYRLIRQNEEYQKRNTTAGLDLAIDDAYTGKTRPVATLSGGESFMASLALALGLSDVVQERSGGIQLDTLFIDEGFGSLDQDSLQLAINTLIDLQSTGRTIGIISHVSELKEQMAQRIEVIGSRGGSVIKMVA